MLDDGMSVPWFVFSSCSCAELLHLCRRLFFFASRQVGALGFHSLCFESHAIIAFKPTVEKEIDDMLDELYRLRMG